MVSVITKVVGRNSYRMSNRWKPSTAKKFVKENRRNGIYAKVLSTGQANKVYRMKTITLKKLRSL